MNRSRSLQLILLVYALQACTRLSVSMDELLRAQDRYDEMSISTYGIVSFQFEKMQLITKHGSLWLSLYTEPYTEASITKAEVRIARWSVLEGQCVRVDGIFRKGGKRGSGHFGGWPAEIASINRIVGVDADKCSSLINRIDNRQSGSETDGSPQNIDP